MDIGSDYGTKSYFAWTDSSHRTARLLLNKWSAFVYCRWQVMPKVSVHAVRLTTPPFTFRFHQQTHALLMNCFVRSKDLNDKVIHRYLATIRHLA